MDTLCENSRWFQDTSWGRDTAVSLSLLVGTAENATGGNLPWGGMSRSNVAARSPCFNAHCVRIEPNRKGILEYTWGSTTVNCRMRITVALMILLTVRVHKHLLAAAGPHNRYEGFNTWHCSCRKGTCTDYILRCFQNTFVNFMYAI